MFAEHQPLLSRLGRSNAAGFERIVTFTLCTIRQPLRLACMNYKLVRAGDTSSLFGSKHHGLAAVQSRGNEWHERCEYAYETAADDEEAADIILSILCEIPCLGPAKAGFVAQMIYGLSGCIDTHNLTRFGISERTFRGREAKYSERRYHQTLRDYNSFCRKVGGTSALWDGWCDYLAARDPINYPSGELVSSLHLIPLEC